jgi:hypothetical protein
VGRMRKGKVREGGRCGLGEISFREESGPGGGGKVG